MPSACRCCARAIALAVLCSAPGAGGAAAQPLSAARSAPSARASDGYASFIAETAGRFGLPGPWITAVIHVESGGDARASSRKGAMGLMQIVPQTWADLRARHHLGSEPFDPCDNTIGSSAYLRELYDRFGGSGFLAAYHAGPRHVAAPWLAYGRSVMTPRPTWQDARDCCLGRNSTAR